MKTRWPSIIAMLLFLLFQSINVFWTCTSTHSSANISNLSWFSLSWLGPLVYLLQKFCLHYLDFQFLDYEHTWWRLFQKRFMHLKFDIYICIQSAMFVLIEQPWSYSLNFISHWYPLSKSYIFNGCWYINIKFYTLKYILHWQTLNYIT